MIRIMTKAFTVLFLSMSLFLPILTGCEQQGPAEQAGEAVDEAAEDTADAVKDATN